MSDEENTPSSESEGSQPKNGGEQIRDVGVEELAKAHGGGDAVKAEGDASTSPDLGLLLDIPVTLSLELGSTRINLGDLLRLNKGAIVELEKEASEPLEVKVNGTLIAYADVVVVNDRYGIRMIDVISESERLRKLS
ncbi:flagellar motor switch protein FliN [Sansalvadorimonas verongulae]|uniref:flagellar motor switch protein FliN n=1 Tax=Sansalvadorimonas verongulae TaxID=2172824 RepID=UPI0012BBB005|nr:flagellar motor switch protein FliN [Sansalvadorimonas verongulae]MTI13240.1 flagellar motor switch protein FliN [Sansalvadorimonas verongulae]